MNFPHIRDTQFPDLQTVDVYRFANTFDYTRWREDTVVRCVNVLWNSDYKDVVKFETDTARDNWFDNITDFYAIELSQAARIVPDNYVKLPIPYDVLARYNYLYIDMPIATSEDAPLDYETSSGIRRWYFFIDSISYLSPNSTQVFLQLDVWTNFQNDVEINYMMLERGHAPVAESDTDEYLANPIANNRYLLAPDVNFDNATVTRSSDYVPFGNGKKYLCIASTCSPDLLSTMGEVTYDANYAPFSGNITYSDVEARYGHQLQVNGLTMGNSRNYSNARTPAKAGYSNGGIIANNLTVYAIQASECYGNGTFFADVMQRCPQFLKTVQACFVVDENCITLGTSYGFAGHVIYECVGTNRNLLSKSLTQNDFNYPAELRRFAKLYTSPYAVLEVTDNDGSTFTINIEETSTVQVKSVVSVAFPYIDYRVYLDGIGGVGSKSYSWQDLRGQTHDKQISESDWFKYCFDWNIPTFALYMDGETAFQLENFNRATRMGIQNALVAYHNNMRSANTARENVEDAADTALANVNNSTATARTNAYNSADTAKTNADNSADTGKANADASADTGKTNADASADTMYDNVNDSCNTKSLDFMSQQTAGLLNIIRSNTYNEDLADRSWRLAAANWNRDMEVAFKAIATQGEAMTSMMGTTAIADIGKGVLQGASGGFMGGGPGGAAIGASVGGISAGIDATVSAMQNSVALSTNALVVGEQQNQGIAKWQDQENFVTYAATEKSDVLLDQRQTLIDYETIIVDRDNVLARGNANRTRTTEKANATRTQTTSKSNATRTQTTSKTNATNTQSTSKTNADNNYNTDRTNATNTRNVTVANADFTRQVAELNAKELLENAANAGMAGILDARNASPVQIGQASGNPSVDYMENRGVQLKVKTQSDSAIRQTGDMFARYGYALNQVWNVAESGLCLMRNFTYWKASDIWVDDRNSSNNSIQDFFINIFLNGVTVWSNPLKMGRVSIYDN